MVDQVFIDRLPDQSRRTLWSMLRMTTFDRDEMIITQNETSADVFFVLEGTATATIYSEAGKVVAYRTISRGDVFGELAAIDGSPRSASVVANGGLKVGRLSKNQFRTLVETSPDFMWALLEYLATQSRQMTERIFEFSTMMVRQRLIQELLRLAKAGRTVNGRTILSPAPTHFDLATRISSHREAVSREMSQLSKLNLINKETEGLVVIDLDALAALSNDI
ncbi:MAG: Crp/Fnr family transcriptional regulator [Pseudomonadota bacterium]